MANKDPVKDDTLSAKADAGAFDAKSGDFTASQQIIQDMQQQRFARWIALCFLVVFAAGTGIMMLSLWYAVYRPGAGSLLETLLLEKAYWPLGFLISGTFLSFIAACGGLVLGAFPAARRKRKEE